MAPFTPFFTEILYQNLRKVSLGCEESIHYCSFPSPGGQREERIEQSVTRMMTVIDLARNIRERHNKPLKSPLREMVVVHSDKDFLEDITGKLREYVMEELNIRSVVPCSDLLKYASLRAEPDFSVLGKRLGKSMGVVAKQVKTMSQADILAFEQAGEVTFSGHCLKISDIKVVRDFKRPADMMEKDMDAAGDGEVLVVLDLRPDHSLFEEGVAREVVNRIQKLRKKAGLEPTDLVDVYFKPVDDDKNVLESVVTSQEQYIKEVLGSPLLKHTSMPSHAVTILEEQFSGIAGQPGLSFVITLTRQTLMLDEDSVLGLCSGNKKHVDGLYTYFLSRDNSTLKSEFQLGNGKIKVDCIVDFPAVQVVLGEHVFLTVGDYCLNKRSD